MLKIHYAMGKYVIAIIFTLFVLNGYSQQEKSTKSSLASKYYNNEEYEKAVELYKELFNKNYSKIYYNYYKTCLVELENYEKAIEVTRQQIKRFSGDLEYYVKLGAIYEKQGNYDKAEEQYQTAIDKLPPSKIQVNQLANTLISNQQYNYAKKVFQKGKKLIENYDFHYEMASLYMKQRNYQKMIDQYLTLLKKRPGNIDKVQGAMQFIVNKEGSGDLLNMLRQNLLKRIRKNPNRVVYNKMLTWMYVQQKKFSAALRQAKALDRRSGKAGGKVIEIADLAVSNTNYSIAKEGYNYVINKGRNKRHYYTAKFKLLDALYKEVVNKVNPTKKEMTELESNYISTINELAPRKRAIILSKELAHLEAFYLDKPDKALSFLDRALNMGTIEPSIKAECLLEKADILLYKGETSRAYLLYSKVENNNAGNPKGNKAKFRKARLAYFTGDFELAHAKLDILKASTSELIANDAFELAELIDDNSTADSTNKPLRLFSKADKLIWQHKDSLAMLTMDSLLNNYKDHSLVDEVYYKKAKVYRERKEYKKAEEFYAKLVSQYSNDIYGDDALLALGKLYENQFNDPEKAMKYYKKVMVEFPGSIHVSESRERFRSLRGD